MIMELILTCICKNPPLSSDPFPPSLSSHSHSISPPTHPITPLSSFSLIFTPDSPHPSIIRPNSLTLAPLSSLLNLSCPTINPHPITSAHSLFHSHLFSPSLCSIYYPTPNSVPHFSFFLPKTIISLLHPNLPILSLHSVTPLLSHSRIPLTPFSHPFLTISSSYSLPPLSSSQLPQPILSFYHYHSHHYLSTT